MSDFKDHPLDGAEQLGRRWSAHLDDYVVAAAWSAGEQTLATASLRGEIAFFAPGSEKPNICHDSIHAPGMNSLSWHPRHPLLASSGQDGQIKIWSEGKLCSQLETRDSWIEKVVWSPDGQWLAAAAGREIYLWELRGMEQFELHLVSHEHVYILTDIAWRPWQRSNPSPPEIAAACHGQISFWQPNKHDPSRLLMRKGSPLPIAWSPDGRYLVCGVQDGTLHLWAFPSERELSMSGYPEGIRALAWDSTSRFLASSCESDIRIWDLNGQRLEVSEPIGLEAHLYSITALAFQKCEPLLASGGRDGLLAVWNPFAGQSALFFDYYENSEISCLCWSGRDNYLVAGTADGQVALYANPTVHS